MLICSPSVNGDPLQGFDGFIKTNQWFDYMNDQPSYPNLNRRTKQGTVLETRNKIKYPKRVRSDSLEKAEIKLVLFIVC